MIASIWGENMLGYLSLDIICSLKLKVFLELRSQKTVLFSEQIMSTDKYPNKFLRQMGAIGYVSSRILVKHIVLHKEKNIGYKRLFYFTCISRLSFEYLTYNI